MLAPYGMIPMVINQAEDSRCWEHVPVAARRIRKQCISDVNPTEEKKAAEGMPM